MIQQITYDNYNKIKCFNCNLITSNIQYAISMYQTQRAYEISLNVVLHCRQFQKKIPSIYPQFNVWIQSRDMHWKNQACSQGLRAVFHMNIGSLNCEWVYDYLSNRKDDWRLITRVQCSLTATLLGVELST